MREKSIVQRFKTAYQTTKRELVGFSAILLIVILLIERVPVQLIGKEVALSIKTVSSIFIGLVILQVLFEIYERLEKSLSELSVVPANDLLRRIRALVERDKRVTIDFIGVAGRNGWQKVISYLLDDTDEAYSILEKREVHIRVALVRSEGLLQIGQGGKIYSQVESIADSIIATKERLRKAGYKNIKIDLYRYEHLPTVLGILVNDNYLFLGHTYWQPDPDDILKLRGGGQQYIAYDKNDVFGGAFFIERFQGWFAYCMADKNTLKLRENISVEGDFSE